MKENKLYQKPRAIPYGIAKIVSKWWVHNHWHLKVERNELRNQPKNRPCIILCNHETQYDFLNLIAISKQRINFVMSNTFYNTVKVKGFLRGCRVIPKQQFQTNLLDMKKMKAVIENNRYLGIYPCGLNSDDGTDAGFAPGTAKFVKWLDCDVYVARAKCSYFLKPKWDYKWRKGNTYMDVYKLLSKEEIENISVEDLDKLIHEKIDYDAYEEQEEYMIKFKNLNKLDGIENLLYQCPKCGCKHKMHVHDDRFIKCDECGFEQEMDEYGMMHNINKEDEIRYASHWCNWIRETQRKEIIENPELTFTTKVRVQAINYKDKKFEDVGHGIITLKGDQIRLEGNIRNQEFNDFMNLENVPLLAYNPRTHFEIQVGQETYRCLPEDGTNITELMNYIRNRFYINHHKEN